VSADRVSNDEPRREGASPRTPPARFALRFFLVNAVPTTIPPKLPTNAPSRMKPTTAYRSSSSGDTPSTKDRSSNPAR